LENDEFKERRQALESKRNAIFTKLKSIDSQAKYKSYEARALHTVLKGKHRPDTRMLKRRLSLLEFKIETEATTLQMERQLMKEIKKTQKEIDDSAAEERQFRKLSYLESDIRECEKELVELEKQLSETNKELSELDHTAREEGKKAITEERRKRSFEHHEKRRKEAHEKAKKETGPFMSNLEPTVTLEDICIIKKKDKEDEDEE
jgi:uncharacterized coiled-coil DUF342 family protein